MPIELDILRGINSAVISAIGTQFPIKALGRVFTKPNSGKWFELVLIEDDNSNETWGREELFSGDLRVILHWPINDEGIYEPVGIIAEIKNRLPKGLRIFNGDAKLLISDVPRTINAIEGTGDMLYSLVVPYQYFHVPS